MSESRRLNGYLWPCCYWAEVHGSKLARGQLSSINHCGKKVIGVLMKTPGPDPTKAYESWSVGQDIVERAADIATSDDAAPEEMDRRQEAALRRVRGVVLDKGDYSKIQFSAGRQSFVGDDDGDDDLLDSVFNRKKGAKRKLDRELSGGDDPGASVEERAGATSSGMSPAKRIRTKSAAKPHAPVDRTPMKTAPSAVSSSGAAGACASATPRRLNTKILDESEQVALKTRQFISSFSMSTVVSITKKALDNIQSLVAKRLTPELVSAYTAKFQPSEDRPEDDGRAKKLHSELGDADQKLVALSSLVASLQARARSFVPQARHAGLQGLYSRRRSTASSWAELLPKRLKLVTSTSARSW